MTQFNAHANTLGTGTAVITAPTADGTTGQAIVTNGSGVLSFATVGGGGGDAETANPLSQFAATTSAELLGVISNETGSGLIMGNSGPTISDASMADSMSLAWVTDQLLWCNGSSVEGIAVGTSGQVLTSNGAGLAPTMQAAAGGSGDVVGPASAVDNNLASFDLTTGKLIQDSGILSTRVIVEDSNGDVSVANGLLHVTGAGTPASGSGLEIEHNGGISDLLSYNRTSPGYLPLSLRAQYIQINPNGSSGPGFVDFTGTGVYGSTLGFAERSSDPANPAEGKSLMWQSDGTGAGDDGDIMIKITAGAVTKTVTLVDFSAS